MSGRLEQHCNSDFAERHQSIPAPSRPTLLLSKSFKNASSPAPGDDPGQSVRRSCLYAVPLATR